MNLQLENQINLEILVQMEYLNLAKELDYCGSKEESMDILLADNNYELVYNIPENTSLISQCLYHFIRSRVAFFQMNFLWFQKETLALIEIWLSDIASISRYIRWLSTSDLLNILSFGINQKSTGFPDLWFNENQYDIQKLDEDVLLLLYQLEKDKIAFIEMNTPTYNY